VSGAVACGAPGPVRDWTASSDVWARSRIDEYDLGLLSAWHVHNCRQITPQFFGPLGRVMFGAATSDEVSDWLASVEPTTFQRSESADPLIVDALIRVRRSSCHQRPGCRCAEFRERADTVLGSRAAVPTSEMKEYV